MKVTKFTYDNPDSDGESTEAEGVIENKSVHDVEYITTSYILVNEAGVTVGGSDTWHDDAFIDSKSSGDISLLSWDSVDAGKINGSGENLKAYFEATTYKREFEGWNHGFSSESRRLVSIKKGYLIRWSS